MSLLAPLGLLALLTLPVIVVLHMLRERRRRVVVPSLLLWQLLPQRQEAQQRRRLPLTLLLLLHLLAAALLAIALARPAWSLALFGSERSLAIVIDTSTSMAAPAAGGSRLDAARARAQELIATSGTSNVSLIAAGSSARLLDAGTSEDGPRLAAALAGLTPAGTGTDIAGALTLAEAALQGRPAPQVIVLTDAALPALESQLAGRALAVPVDWQRVGGPSPNRAIVTLAARPRPGNGPVQVFARLANYDSAPFRGVMRLYGDDAILDTRPVSMDANGQSELTWAVPRGTQMLRAELDGNDRLPVDDSFSISLAQTRPVSALLVSARPAALERALRAVPGLALSTVDPAGYRGSNADLTIFDGFLPPAWPAGGVLAIDPPPGSPLLEVSTREREAAPEAVVQVAPGPLLDGVSIASVSFGAVRDVTAPEGFATLLRRGEQPLILRGRRAQSEIAVWAFDLSQGNLTTRLAFPLLVARAARDLTPPPLPPSALLGETLAIRPDPRADRLELGAPDGSVQSLDVAPGEPVELSLAQAGIYTVAERAGGSVLAEERIGVNAGSPVESDLTPRQLPASITGEQARGSASDGQQPLWPWLAAAALLVMLGEWLYVNGRRRPLPES